MKKNYLLGMFAAASMLLATSCSSDELESVQSGNEAQITFSVGAKGGIDSRALVGDGTKADKLVWAVYNEAGEPLNVFKSGDSYVGQETHTGVSDMTQTAKEVTVNLAKGQKYKVLFWAQDADCMAYTTTDLRKVEVSYENAANNDELRDAFFACKEIEVKGNETFKVDLKRPFAQINVGVTKADWDAAVASGITVKQSQVVIKNAATSIDLLDGSVDGSTDVIYNLADIISAQDLEVDLNDNDNIDEDEKFEYLSMSYILVNETTTGAAKANLESLEFTFAPEAGEGNPIIFKDGLTNVPVQRNWRTNIIGQILTGTIKFEVKIDNRFDDEYNISSWGGDQTAVTPTAEGVYEIKQATDLRWVANQISSLSDKEFKNQFNGKTIKLMADINLAGQAWTPINSWHAEGNTHVTLDGNGHKIIGMQVKAGTSTGFIGSNAADWTIKNLTFVDANVESTGNFVGVVFGYQYGDVVMENVDVQGGSVKSTANIGIRIGGLVGFSVVNDGATLSLTDCDVDGVTLQGYHNIGGLVGSVMTEGKATMTNCTSTNNTFCTNNGTANYSMAWNAFDCNGYTEGKSTKKNCTESGNKLVCLSTTAEGFAAALTANDEDIYVILQNDIDVPITSLGQQTAGSGEYKLGGENTKNITIDLNGKKLNITTTYWSNLGAKNDDATFTIKNGTMTSSQATGTWNSYDLCFSNCDYVIEDVVFEKAISFGNANNTVSLKNVTINETHDYYAMWIEAVGQTVTIDGLTINSSGRGIKIDEQYVGTPAKVTLNINDATFKTEKKAAIMVKSEAGAEINLSEININNVNEDAFNAVWVDEDAAAYADLVIVNGGLKKVEGQATVLNAEYSTITLVENVDYGALTAGELKNVTIEGAEGTVMILKTTADTKIENVTLKNVSFEYTGATVDCGIVIDANAQIDNLVLERCTFTGTGTKAGRGLSGLNNNASIVIKDCTFKDLGYPIYAWGGYEALTIEGCTFDNIKSWAIMPQSGFDGDLTVTGCTFKNCLGGGLIKAGTMTAGHTFTFTDNVITGCTIAGDHNWFQFNVSASTSVISGNTKDGAAWTPGTSDGLKCSY